MNVLKILLAVCVLLALVLVGAGAYLHFADLNPHRGKIAAYLSDTLKREVRLEGDLELRLWPELSLSVEGVHLANAPWGSEPEMAKIDKAALQIRLRSLWQGPLDIMDAQLSNTDLVLENGPDGGSNWALGETAKPGGDAPDTGGLGLILNRLSIERFTLRMPGPETEQRFELDSLTLAADQADRLLLEGQGVLLDLPLKVTGDLGTRQQLAADGTLDYDLTLSLGESTLTSSGSRTAPAADGTPNVLFELQVSGLQSLLDTLNIPLAVGSAGHVQVELSEEDGLSDGLAGGTAQGQFGDIEFEIQLEAGDEALDIRGSVATLERVGAVFAAEGLPDLPVKFSASLVQEEAVRQIERFSIEVGRAEMRGSGTLAGKEGGSAFELEASGALASELLPMLPGQPFSLRADIATSAEGLLAQLLEANLGDSDVKGSIKLPSGQANAIELELESQRIDLVQLLPPAEPTGGARSGGNPSSEPAKAVAPANFVFSEAPFPFDALQDTRLEGGWKIAQLVTSLMVLEAVSTTASLKDGTLDLDTEFSGADGGTGRNHLVLESGGEVAVLRLENQLRDLRVNLVSGEVAGPDEIPPLSLTLDLTARGDSARAMAASSEGDVLLTIGPGQMTNSLMERFSSDIVGQLVSALNPFAKTRTRMGFQCGVVAVAIEDGVARLDPLMAQTDKLQVVAGGTADLNTERLNIEFNTKPRSGVGVSADMFVTPFVSLEGTLAHPGVGINEKSSLLTAGAAMATGGMSLLWKGMLDRATGALDHCSDIWEQYRHPPLGQAEAR